VLSTTLTSTLGGLVRGSDGAGVHALPSARASESTMTSAPNATQAYAGIVVQRSRKLVSFKKQATGKMYASKVADTLPVISSVTPRLHIISDTVGRQASEVGWYGRGQGAGSVRTKHGGDEDNGCEEKVSLHIESFVREKKLLDYLYGHNL
jgi:hypothetical protein